MIINHHSSLQADLQKKRKDIAARWKLAQAKARLQVPSISLPTGGVLGTRLDPRLTFEMLYVSGPNRLACAEALRCVAEPKPVFNPVYIHSMAGLGKTHILQAIAHAAAKAGRMVAYFTAPELRNGLYAGTRAQRKDALDFKRRLGSIDMLLIDDIQIIHGKAIGQELSHILDSMISSDRQLVVSSDRPPMDLKRLDERTRSRLGGGVCAEISDLDEKLKLKILEANIASAKQAHPAFDIPPASIAYIAKATTLTGRGLEGAVNRLVAHTLLHGGTMDIETVKVTLKELIIRPDSPKVSIKEIQSVVGSHFKVKSIDMLSARRTRHVLMPRHIAMYLSKMLTPCSLPEIGRLFGGRDHTTVLFAVRRIEGMRESDPGLNAEVELLSEILLR